MSLHRFLARGSVIGALAALVMAGCGSDNTPAKDGGSGGTGGKGGSGGSGTGGGGGTGTGGSGTGGGGGGSATGGSGGNADASTTCPGEQYTHTFNFGAIFEGWLVNPTYSSGVLVQDPTVDGSTGTVLSIDSADGSPVMNGSLKMEIPFNGPGQLLLLQQLSIFTTGLNFQGTRVTAQIKLDSGFITSPSDTGRANLVLKSGGGYVYAAGPAVVLDPSAGWVTMSIDPDNPGPDAINNGFSPCDVREIDIEVHTGDTGNYRAAVMHLDTVMIASKKPPTDGGADGSSDSSSSDGSSSDGSTTDGGTTDDAAATDAPAGG